jgi:hypothetical protein
MGFMQRAVMAFAAIAALTTGAMAAGGAGGGDGFGLGGLKHPLIFRGC